MSTDESKAYQTLRGFVTGDEPADLTPTFSYYAMLRISSDSGLDFESIRRELQVAPTATLVRGQRRGPRSQESPEDAWMYRPPVADNADLEEHVNALWSTLKPHEDYILALKASYCVRIILGYSSNIDHAGLVLSSESLELFSRLRVPLELNIVVL